MPFRLTPALLDFAHVVKAGTLAVPLSTSLMVNASVHYEVAKLEAISFQCNCLATPPSPEPHQTLFNLRANQPGTYVTLTPAAVELIKNHTLERLFATAPHSAPASKDLYALGSCLPHVRKPMATAARG